jgi:hypothetical protein
MNKLFIVAVAGLATSAVCMGAAAAIGGKSLADDLDLSFMGGLPRCETIPGASAASRDIPWDGSDRVSLTIRSHAQYSPGNGTVMHVTGDPQILAHLRLREGHVELDCNNFFGRSDRGNLNITLPGRTFETFTIAGSGQLQLDEMNQDKLNIVIAGSGSVKGTGKVDHLEIHIAGSGDADLGQVTSSFTEVHIAGSGKTDIAPSNEADIHIAGSGDVTLHSHPQRMERSVHGSGRIREVSDS